MKHSKLAEMSVVLHRIMLGAVLILVGCYIVIYPVKAEKYLDVRMSHLVSSIKDMSFLYKQMKSINDVFKSSSKGITPKVVCGLLVILGASICFNTQIMILMTALLVLTIAVPLHFPFTNMSGGISQFRVLMFILAYFCGLLMLAGMPDEEGKKAKRGRSKRKIN